jgi:hypothetical protein
MPEKQWCRYFLLVLLTSIIGAGFLVNTVLKPYCGRPRPSQVREFGGHYVYRHVLDPGIPGKGESFPSGHSTMGFVFISLVYFRRKSPMIAWLGGLAGLTYGSLISAARVVQGAHFVTDCFWSLGVLWLTATVLYYFVLRIPEPKQNIFRRLTRRQKQFVVSGGILLALMMALFFLTRRPYFESYHVQIGMYRNNVTELQVGLVGGYDRSEIRYIEQGAFRILVHSSGFAFPGSSEKPKVVSADQTGGVLKKVYQLEPKGYLAEIRHEIEAVIPVRLKNKLTVVFLDEQGHVSRP